MTLATFTLCSCNKNTNGIGTIPPAQDTHLAKYGELDYKELKEKIGNNSVTIIDVNSPESYKLGHIPTAISYYAHQEDLASVLPLDKGAEIVCYCGGPSCTAWLRGADAVSELGYTNVKHFKGGLSGWSQAGGELE